MKSRRGRSRVNTKELIRIMGHLALIEASFMLIPLIVSLAWGESDALTFGISTAIVAAIGLGIIRYVKPRNNNMGKRDGILLTASVWVVFSLLGMLPFMISSLRLNFFDAFFEAMSGFTTTGASVIADVSNLSHGIHVWRCLMQWIGGVGIIIFTVAVLPMFNSSGGMQMFNAELSGITHDKLQPRISQTAKRVWLIYCCLTLSLAIILWLGPMDAFESFCHALSTVSTGGFSTANDSLGHWNSMYVNFFILVFMFIGGVNFALIYRASVGQFNRAWSDVNFRWYLRAIIASTLFIIVVLLLTTGFTGLKRTIVDPLFQVVSLITSTGYVDENISSWHHVIVPVLIVLMFSGACAGSTSGGVKVDRLVYLWKSSRIELRKVVHSNRFYPLTINGTARPTELVVKVGAFMVLYVIILLVSGMLLTAIGLSMTDAFFSTFSCISNTGLGMGTTAASYADVPAFGKMVLAGVMLIGRLEIFTILILFTQAFWRR